MTAGKKKTPVAAGVINTETNQTKRKSSVNTTLASTDNFDTRFILRTGNDRIWIQPQEAPDGSPLVEVTDDFSNLLLSPAEALTVAAALEAVAVHLLEEPRELHRRTEPGNPRFEEDL